MSIIRDFVKYFITGAGYGSITYLSILGFLMGGGMVSTREVITVFLISGLIGLITLVFKTDIPLMPAFCIHLVSTFILFLLMMWLNSWSVDYLTVGIFLIVYIVIWFICLLEQNRTLWRINAQLKKKRSSDYKKL